MGYVKLIDCGNSLEIFQYQYDLNRNRSAVRTARVDRRDDSVERRADNIKRLRSKFIRLVRSNLAFRGNDYCPWLITLTTVATWDVSVGYRFFRDFIHRLRSIFGSDFYYIAVPEFQKRGRLHFHMLVWGLPEKELNAEANRSKRGYRAFQRLWARGYLDCVRTDGSGKLAFYLGKYFTKSLHDKRLLGQKSYVTSRNCKRPVEISSTTVLDYLSEIWGIGVDSKPVLSKEFDTEWLGKGRYTYYSLNRDI